MFRAAHLFVAAVALAVSVLGALPSGADSPAPTEAFKASAAKSAARLRELAAYKQGGCDINALVGVVISRSREPLLHMGDRIASVNGQVVQATTGNSPLKVINALPPTGKVRLGLVRKQSHLTATIQCLNSADRLSAIIAAYDAAAGGKFSDCADRANDYSRDYVQQAAIYGLWRRCSIFAGLTTDEAIRTTFLTYWTLRLQELKGHPEKVDENRSDYLGAQTQLMDHGQSLLLGELRRQWSLATGETSSAPPPPPEPVKHIAPPPAASQLNRYGSRASGSSCEDGHWIQEVMGDGSIIKLEDGSLWRVDDVDTVDSALWLPTTDIVVCDGKLINTEDNESVEAQRIH